MKKLTIIKQVILFQYVVEKGLPEWAKGEPMNVFARLMNKTEAQAKKDYERTCRAGYLDKR